MADPVAPPPRRLLRWAWIPVTLVAIGGLAWLVDWRSVGRELAAADPADVALMMGVWLVWLAVRPLRMRTLVRATGQGDGLTRNDAFGAHAVGMAVNNLLPMRAGATAAVGSARTQPCAASQYSAQAWAWLRRTAHQPSTGARSVPW